jgi:hypothetical protein
MGRTIKLGRKAAVLPALHWAVKVGPIWYEIVGKGADNGEKGGPNEVRRNYGEAAESGAGSLGGEIVGQTTKSDSDIDSFIDEWLSRNARYEFLLDNCQKFAYDFILFLTDGSNFRLPHRFDAVLSAKDLSTTADGFPIAEDGIAIARIGMGETRASAGYSNSMHRGPSFEASAVAGAGLGAWAGASPLGRANVNLGPVLGAHLEPNLNTGLGVRDGNLDVHLLGFGARVGADGREVNTPMGGVNDCVIT